MSDYSELLKDPRWQKKRLKIMERDNFECRACHETNRTLNVHHLYYDYKLKPWEYNNEDLITLCEDCHNTLHFLEKSKLGIDCIFSVTDCILQQQYENMKRHSKSKNEKNG